MDKRKATRYPVKCPTTLCWTNGDQEKKASQSVTRDISLSGVFILDPASPPLGTRVQLSISVPNLAGTSHGLRVTATGEIIRVDHIDSNTTSGFAAAVEFDLGPATESYSPALTIKSLAPHPQIQKEQVAP